jgi:hypothetical protein
MGSNGVVATVVPRRRTAASMAFVVLVTCLVTGLFVPVARASCAGPTLGISVADAPVTGATWSGETQLPVLVTAGDRISVEGSYFVDGCADSFACTASCGGQSCSANETPRPLRRIELTLVTGDVRTSLGTKDADSDGRVVWDTVIPVDVTAGPASLEAEPASTVEPVSTLPLLVGAA